MKKKLYFLLGGVFIALTITFNISQSVYKSMQDNSLSQIISMPHADAEGFFSTWLWEKVTGTTPCTYTATITLKVWIPGTGYVYSTETITVNGHLAKCKDGPSLFCMLPDCI
ncbi:MAG: hypothetical protein PF541_15725 [Prolixibacteraceae bacterium]|jgi:hypothetical protein|nr:hypothetical protein [Prolixibacteraceae bacterium]